MTRHLENVSSPSDTKPPKASLPSDATTSPTSDTFACGKPPNVSLTTSLTTSLTMSLPSDTTP